MRLIQQATNTPIRATLSDRFYPGGPRQVAIIVLWVGASGLFSLSLFLRPMRRTAAGLLPIYADSFVHIIALGTVVGMTAMLFVPLAVLGEPPFLQLLSNPAFQEELGGTATDKYFDTIVAFVWLVPCAVLAVGFPIARTIRQSLLRVGLVRPSILQVVFRDRCRSGFGGIDDRSRLRSHLRFGKKWVGVRPTARSSKS